jgi:hypothetical protein
MSCKRKASLPSHIVRFQKDHAYSSVDEESGEDEQSPKRRRTVSKHEFDSDDSYAEEDIQIRERTFDQTNTKVLNVTYLDGETVTQKPDQDSNIKESLDQFIKSEPINTPGVQNSILLIFDSLRHVNPVQPKKTRKLNPSGECTNCKTVKSPIWRKGPNNSKLCNKCGLYWKRYNKQRPLELEKPVEFSSKNDHHENLMLLIAAVHQMQEVVKGA